jgi:hypothetical protein
MIALAPAGAYGFQARDDLCGALGIFGEREGFAARQLQDFVIAQRLRYGKGGVAVLAGAEKFAGAALLQVLLGDFETVAGGDHGFDAGAGFAANIFARDKDAARFFAAASDAAAQLMELREAEAVGVLDDH